jgi:hypothetical protein
MRQLADAARIRAFMRALAREAPPPVPARIYFAGGATAVLIGWRSSTIDVDLRVEPESDAVFRAIPKLKEELQINVELATPLDFLPIPEGWESRSPFIEQIGPLSFHHFDLYGQALAKVERGHAQDVVDVREMLRRGLIDREHAREYFAAMESRLHRFPAIDPRSLRRAVDEAFRE